MTMAKLAIIIPTYKHNVFVVEAIESALAQDLLLDYAIIMVNDGCPFPETQSVGRAFRAKFPEIFHYLEKPNGGLSSARNAGIDYALREFPNLELIYFLDADNRLRPTSLSNAEQLMRKTGADWIYPSINMIGLEQGFSYYGKYSKLIHREQNLCEAGSLIKADIVRCGLRFDENMLKGYEDWEFWLNCAASGFRGAYCDNFGFRYRKRAESMLSSSHSKDSEIRAYISDKHSDFFSVKKILEDFYNEFPQLIVFDIEKESAFVVKGLDDIGLMSVENFKTDLWKAISYPDKMSFPSRIVFCKGFGELLSCSNNIIHWVLSRKRH